LVVAVVAEEAQQVTLPQAQAEEAVVVQLLL